MKHTVKIKVVVELTFDATFEDTLAASDMFKALERHANPSTIRSMAADRWSIRADAPLRVGVESLHGRNDTP
jgi:hypothetical protein